MIGVEVTGDGILKNFLLSGKSLVETLFFARTSRNCCKISVPLSSILYPGFLQTTQSCRICVVCFFDSQVEQDVKQIECQSRILLRNLYTATE